MNNALVAHRGYSAEYPENTLLAIESALALGACYVEIDIHLTADQVAVVIHDKDLTRTAGQAVNIMQSEYSHLGDFSVHYPSKFGKKYLPQRIPTLKAVLEVFERYPNRKLFIEVKRSSIANFGGDTILSTITPLLIPVAGQCALISYNPEFIALAKAKNLCKVGWIFENWDEDPFTTIENINPDYLFTDYLAVPDNGENLPQGPWRWGVYTIDQPEVALQWFAKGASLVETNNFGKLIKFPGFGQYCCSDN